MEMRGLYSGKDDVTKVSPVVSVADAEETCSTIIYLIILFNFYLYIYLPTLMREEAEKEGSGDKVYGVKIQV